MRRRRKVLIAFGVVGLFLVAAVALRLLPLFTGPGLPQGAVRLQIATAQPNLNMGCPTALLLPVRVAETSGALTLVSVETGAPIAVVWPSGFGAWRVDGRVVVADPWGSVVGRDGDILDSLGGGVGLDGAFGICPFGIVTRP